MMAQLVNYNPRLQCDAEIRPVEKPDPNGPASGEIETKQNEEC